MTMVTDEVREIVPLRTHVCLPGDPVLTVGATAVVGLGGGLRALPHNSSDNALHVIVSEVCAPVERQPHPLHPHVSKYTAESPAVRRYAAQPGEPVVAIVAKKVSQHYYYCYIGGQALAMLDVLAFDGATKSSRPRLVEGDVVYAYVKPQQCSLLHQTDRGAAAPPSASLTSSQEVELSCQASGVGLTPKDWTSGESVFGPLEDGRVLYVPLAYARSLLTPQPASAVGGRGGEDMPYPASYLLDLLGQRVPFEVCVGANGIVWVKGQASAQDPTAMTRRTVAVAACLSESQYDATKLAMEARVASYFPADP